MKRALNLYEFIFGTLFLLKISDETAVAELSWFWILLPMLVNFIHLFFAWTWKTLDLSESFRHEIRKYYYSKVYDKAKKEAVQNLKNNSKN